MSSLRFTSVCAGFIFYALTKKIEGSTEKKAIGYSTGHPFARAGVEILVVRHDHYALIKILNLHRSNSDTAGIK